MVKLYMLHHLSLLLLMILDTFPSFPLKWTIKVLIFHCLTSQMEMRNWLLIVVKLSLSNNTYLSMKEGSLFCFVLKLWDPPNWDASDHVLVVFGKLSTTRRGAWDWFHDVWTCGAKVLWILNGFFTEN